jgi:hypothetical protein
MSRKMNDVLAGAACDFDDDTPRRQDAAKDIKNEIAITYGCRRVLPMIGHLLAYSTWRELCLRHAPKSASRRVGMCSLQRFLVIRFQAVYGVAHRHVIFASLSEPRDPCDETTTRAADRPWLDLAMTRSLVRFIDLFVRSAPWRRA